RLDRHRRDHGHDQCLEQQGKAAAWPCPWDVYCLDAALVAADARHAGMQIGLVLKEVEVAPSHPLGIIGRAVRRTAGRAGEAAARGEVDLDVEPMCLGVKVAAAHRPRWGQSQCLLQQRGVTHVWYPALARPDVSKAPCSPPSMTLRAASGG